MSKKNYITYNYLIINYLSRNYFLKSKDYFLTNSSF